MTTDTKAVARWDWDVEVDDYEQFDDGHYVLFTDHERVVGELRTALAIRSLPVREYTEEIDSLRTALAASRAEVEGLRSSLTLIANLDPETDSAQGFNEWGEADCFGKAQEIARKAIEGVSNV